MTNFSEALKSHKKLRGKIEMKNRVRIRNKHDLSIFYTPGVAEPCREIHKNPEASYLYTNKWNSVAVITDGSAVLGLGNIGPRAAMPVMEGKCMLFKQFGNIDAVPICLDTQDPLSIIQIVKALAPTFGGINLEDISAPRCFEIERQLQAELDIPIFHDDQHGTAICVLAGLTNALKVCKKSIEVVKIVISGAGAAGLAITDLLLKSGVKHITVFDSRGSIFDGRPSLDPEKARLSKLTNKEFFDGNLKEGIKGADVFIGVSAPNIVTAEMVKSMAKDPIVFAMANPTPEIMPEEAIAGGAKVIATGRSDYPNQINNVLVFPGLLRGLLDNRKKLTDEIKVAAAKALADLIKNPTPKNIIPDVFNKNVAKVIAQAVKTM